MADQQEQDTDQQDQPEVWVRGDQTRVAYSPAEAVSYQYDGFAPAGQAAAAEEKPDPDARAGQQQATAVSSNSKPPAGPSGDVAGDDKVTDPGRKPTR